MHIIYWKYYGVGTRVNVKYFLCEQGRRVVCLDREFRSAQRTRREKASRQRYKVKYGAPPRPSLFHQAPSQATPLVSLVFLSTKRL